MLMDRSLVGKHWCTPCTTAARACVRCPLYRMLTAVNEMQESQVQCLIELTRSAVVVVCALIGFGVENTVRMHGQGALNPVQKCDVDRVSHGGPQYGP